MEFFFEEKKESRRRRKSESYSIKLKLTGCRNTTKCFTRLECLMDSLKLPGKSRRGHLYILTVREGAKI
jgi:hypothetical protein